MKTLYYYDEKQLKHVEYPWWKIPFWLGLAFFMGMIFGMVYAGIQRIHDTKVRGEYRNIMYQDSTTVIYQPIHPDSIKGDSKVAKDLRWQYRKNKK